MQMQSNQILEIASDFVAVYSSQPLSIFPHNVTFSGWFIPQTFPELVVQYDEQYFLWQGEDEVVYLYGSIVPPSVAGKDIVLISERTAQVNVLSLINTQLRTFFITSSSSYMILRDEENAYLQDAVSFGPIILCQTNTQCVFKRTNATHYYSLNTNTPYIVTGSEFAIKSIETGYIANVLVSNETTVDYTEAYYRVEPGARPGTGSTFLFYNSPTEANITVQVYYRGNLTVSGVCSPYQDKRSFLTLGAQSYNQSIYNREW
jgi:hypothetical protein